MFQEADVAGVALDEAAPALDVLAHQDREDLSSAAAASSSITLSRTRWSGSMVVVPTAPGSPSRPDPCSAGCRRPSAGASIGEAGLEHRVTLAVGVGELVGVVAPLEAVERRLREVDVALLDEGAHEPEQQRQQQGPDVQAVDIGIGHQHDLVVSRLGLVEVLADAGAERRDQRLHLVVGEHLVDAGLLDVEDLASDGQDRLVVRVAPAHRRTTGRVTLDDEDLGDRGVLALAVTQLAGQAAGLDQALAPGGLARLAGRHAGSGSLDRLADDVLALGRVGSQPVAELVGHGALNPLTSELPKLVFTMRTFFCLLLDEYVLRVFVPY